MSTILKQMMTIFALVAIVVIATAGAQAQDKDSKSDKKVLVTVTTIENGDTTVTVEELGAGKSGHTWVDSEDGNVFIITEDDAHSDHDGDVMFFSDEGYPVIEHKKGDGQHRDKKSTNNCIKFLHLCKSNDKSNHGDNRQAQEIPGIGSTLFRYRPLRLCHP